MSFYDKVRRQKVLSFTVIIFTLAVGILIGTLVQTGAKAARPQTEAQDATPLTIPKEGHIENDFTRVVKKLGPSVVNIQSEYIPKSQPQARGNGNRPRQQQQAPDDDGDNSMQDFFNRFFGGQGGGQGGGQFGQPEDRESASLGSGFIVDPNGYILTNNHVVEKATKIKVKFADSDTEYPAKVIGTDADTDLAVIKVERKGLTPARIGNSDVVEPGDWSIAIGSPFGFQATVTAGIISAVARDVQDTERPSSFQHFLQTDAAINPGNSGGPLANINGEVIGINTMIASRSGGYQGIGFAMPINAAVKVYNSIIKYGHVSRGSIGISFKPDDTNTSALLKVYGADHGIFVESVQKDGPADKAGIEPQDIVTSIDGKQISKGQQLIDIVADSPIGTSLKVGVIRDKKPMMLDVVVGDRTKVFAELYGGAPASPQDNGPDATQMKFGMSIQPVRPADRDGMNFKGGVMVSSVDPGSFADDIQLQKGDVIVEMNRQPVSSPGDIQRIQANLKPGDPVAFHVERQLGGGRGGNPTWQSLFIAGTIPPQ